ncbi:MAG: hypothetical protein IJV15_12625 [Lachnospiraceae bacterium]|nr:hypothetical protein [Lachnospiraceae bacterium]
MNISLFAQTSYSNMNRNPYGNMREDSQGFYGLNGQNAYSQNSTGGNSFMSDINNSYANSQNSERLSKNRQMRAMIRDLNNSSDKSDSPFSIYSKDGRLNDIWEMSKSSDKDEDKVKKPLNYNYKEVSNKIQRAKNSITAGQAMLSAKRKVLELKRKIANGDGDADELQLALTHATRMEMVARKKKHNLELEELAEITRQRDEKLDKMKETASNMKNQMIEAKEDEISEDEDDIFEEREAMLEELQEEIEERNEEVSEEMMAELNAQIAEFGEEALREMEEAMELLEELEMLDPHMSEEELEKVKRKHRASEEKAILKADMDYLKDTIKHQMAQTNSMSGFGGGSSSVGSATFSASVGGADLSVSAAADVSMPSIDISA